MGAVFLADDLVSRQQVALKIIVPAYAGEPTARARFAVELEAVAALRHVNIVRLLRAGEASGAPYAVFERVRGRPLSRIGPQPWPFVVQVGRQLASAVAAIHAAGWLHRDVKPSNVMVGDHGLVTLLDFGLAKRLLAREDGELPCIAARPGWTTGGTIVGTKRYLAPEVRSGRRATTASDVFALGLTLQELHDGSIGTPAVLTNLIARAIDDDPRRRPSADAFARTIARLPGGVAPRRGHFDSSAPTWPVDADCRPTCEEHRLVG